MQTRDDIIQALARLDAATFEDVLDTALRQRSALDSSAPAQPDHQAGPEAYARWLAQRHLATDVAIQRVVYLPNGSPNDEIRLLEINRFQSPAENNIIEPVDFSPDIDRPPYKVFVADVTSDEWERIQRDPSTTLPQGWLLEGYRVCTRG
jgi:hypothetical protein